LGWLEFKPRMDTDEHGWREWRVESGEWKVESGKRTGADRHGPGLTDIDGQLTDTGRHGPEGTWPAYPQLVRPHRSGIR
jgi:hypothetical protein